MVFFYKVFANEFSARRSLGGFFVGALEIIFSICLLQQDILKKNHTQRAEERIALSIAYEDSLLCNIVLPL